MAVYTEVTADEAQGLLQQLGLGQLISLQGCTTGIENTNYFVTSERAGQAHDYVLTLFERLTFEQLPFYLGLMKHLAQNAIPVPNPCANAQGQLLFDLRGKPAAVVNRLGGQCVLSPSPAHCAAVGAMLARMHLAGRNFALVQPNLRGLAWWNKTVPAVLPYLQVAQADLLRAELAYQNDIARSKSYAALPVGPIHADLFRDNVMFQTGADGERLSGFFDFYFAGVDHWLFDIAVAVNDWCVHLNDGSHDAQRFHSFLAAYQRVRPLQAAESLLMAAMLRAAALRFWLSRLWDYHLPRSATLLIAHDPGHFERLLRQRIGHPPSQLSVELVA